MTTQIDLKLDAIEDHVSKCRRDVMEAVEQMMLIHLKWEPRNTGYIDGLCFDALHNKGRNVVGPAIRGLMKAGKIEQTGNHKRSTRPESNGRVIWEYRLT